MPEADFFYTGFPETFTVPPGVTDLTVFAKSPGLGDEFQDTVGRGVLITGTLPVTPGEPLIIRVGGLGTTTQGGFNGGGAPGAQGDVFTGTGGNGATDIRQHGIALADRIIVCGAPGGYGEGSFIPDYHNGTNYLDPAVIDGGLPDGSARIGTVTGSSATQATPGLGGNVLEFGVYDYGDSGSPGVIASGGAGGPGADLTVVINETKLDSVPGPATLSNISDQGTYSSGPRNIYGPYLVPMWGRIRIRVESFDNPTSNFTASAGLTTTPGDPRLTDSFAGYPGPGTQGDWDNVTGSEQSVYVWAFSVFGTGACAYDLHIEVQQGPIDPGGGGGGGLQGGGGGSSNVDEGTTGAAAVPDGLWGGGGGGGSSYVTPLMIGATMTDGSEYPFHTFKPWSPGFVFLLWDVTSNVPPLHIPHKEWANDVTDMERQNYYAIERWSYYVHLDPTVDFDLFIPHKDWSSPEELENYLEIERWANEPVNGFRYPDLLIPHKEWASPFERENYYAIERWVRANFT